MPVDEQQRHYTVERWGTIVDPDDARPLVFSYGAGLDSFFALTRILEADVRDDDAWSHLRRRLAAIVHCDLGEELPETLAHLNDVAIPFARQHGFEITVLRPRVVDRFGQHHDRLRTYLLAQAVVPSRTRRWCSDRFKITPISQWATDTFGPDAFDTLLGYDSSEGHRTRRLSDKQRARLVLPLMDEGWTRPSMTAALEAEGRPVPIKSRCSFCPFSKVREIAEIDACHPEILEADIALEEAITAENGRPTFTFLHRPLRAIRDTQRDKAGREAGRIQLSLAL
jgi:3'-phosphoadenosine 5'-phosphosulfate sulfotransferase (PAPS reductase)/FAD synthetase